MHAGMWQAYSAQHTQRGDVTAVVWGTPGTSPQGEEKSAAAVAAAAAAAHGGVSCSTSSRSSTPPGGEAGVGVVDAEALTRGRRAETPFVQQCDLVFPLPGRDSGYGGGDVLKEQQVRKAAGAEEVEKYSCLPSFRS